MSKEKIVVTVKNESLPISQCRQFDKNWYKIGDVNIEESGDCYFINNKHYREETGAVVFNYSINQYVLKDDNVMKGIIDIDEKGNIKFGYYNRSDEYATIRLENGNTYSLFNEESIVNNKEYREVLSSGVYCHINTIPARRFNEIVTPRQEYKTSLPYDSKGITDKFLYLYNKNYNPNIYENISKYSKILGGLSFGLEFETTKGFIPERIINKFGLIPLRDGSISGIEYVTVPLEGEKGLQYILDVCKTLETRTEYDNSCSLHQHIGNVPRTKEFILSFFKLTCSLQNEIFEMFPLFKKYNFKVKNKNYSKPYPIYDLLGQMDAVINSNNIDENFNVLYEYLSGGQHFNEVGCDLKNVQFHPNDPNGNQKWQIRNRYYVHNMIPLIFGNKQTVEFRIHTPTYDVNKIIPFLLINSILVNYVINNQDNILGIKGFLCNKSLLTIISDHLNHIKLNDNGLLFDSLIQYIDTRKKVTENQNADGNIIGNESQIKGSRYLDWNKAKNEMTFNFNRTPSYRFDSNFITDAYEKEIDKLKSAFAKKLVDKDYYIRNIKSYRNSQKTYRKERGLPEIQILENEYDFIS